MAQLPEAASWMWDDSGCRCLSIQAKKHSNLRKRMNGLPAKPVCILLVDDHAVFRVGLRMIIQSRPHLTVVAEAGNREGALVKAEKEQPDIILLDLDLGNNGGIALIS